MGFCGGLGRLGWDFAGGLGRLGWDLRVDLGVLVACLVLSWDFGVLLFVSWNFDGCLLDAFWCARSCWVRRVLYFLEFWSLRGGISMAVCSMPFGVPGAAGSIGYWFLEFAGCLVNSFWYSTSHGDGDNGLVSELVTSLCDCVT